MGAPTSVMVNEPGAARDTLRFAAQRGRVEHRPGLGQVRLEHHRRDRGVGRRGGDHEPLLVDPVLDRGERDVGRQVAVTVTFTSVTDEVPFAFVALTPNWYVPVAVVGVVLTVIADDALAVAADGVCVNGRVAGPPTCDHDQLGVGLLGLVAVMVNELPAVIVCAWIGLIAGAGAAWTVIVVDAVAVPHGLSAISER